MTLRTSDTTSKNTQLPQLTPVPEATNDADNGRITDMDRDLVQTQTWHCRPIAEANRRMHVCRESGLSADEAARRLREFGPNAMADRGQKSLLQFIWEQLTATLILVLLAAAVVSAALGDVEDALAIGAIIALNVGLGVQQERRAERAIAALQQMATPSVRVRRDGEIVTTAATELVPGDIVLLEAGNQVPADGRLLLTADLRIAEAALTGESEPVEKDAHAEVPESAPLGDRKTMAYQGASVVHGRGEMLVTATAMATELGRIASMIQNVRREPTPMQRRLDRLGKWLALAAVGIIGLIVALGLPRVDGFADLKLLFMTAVSLAVAAVPEGLPAVVTIALALGAQRMLRRRVLIRKLPAVETLGAVTTICSDKTGTLTKNQMAVTVVDVAGETLELNAATQERPTPSPAVSLLLVAAELCNDAAETKDEHGKTMAVGDPTESAMVTAAQQFGWHKPELDQLAPRVHELPFDSERKRMTTVHQVDSEALPPVIRAAAGASDCLVITKGAIDGLLEICTTVWNDGTLEPLDGNWKQRIRAAHDALAAKGMRVLAVAFRPWRQEPPQSSENSPAHKDVHDTLLEAQETFVGLLGLVDPPRDEAKHAIAICRSAGIRPVMITGDHPLTAKNIAKQLGIDVAAGVITGNDLDAMSAEQIRTAANQVSVYARVTPEHKLKLVESLQQQGEVVAMTGDGVNDAPALKRADIGVAMGITGTDVSKEAADMVLQDDNFSAIVAAVEEGRVIFDNIRKFIRYLLSANAGELMVMMIGPLMGMPMPLWPLQILWMNLVTDGLPALALGVEPAERSVMNRDPYPPKETVFARGVGVDILWIGSLMAAVSLAVAWGYWDAGAAQWQTVLFTTLTFSQVLLALAVRSDRESLARIGLNTNRPMLAAVALTFVLQLLVIYVPVMNRLLHTQPLGVTDLMTAFAASTVVFAAVELKKWAVRRRDSSGGAAALPRPRHAVEVR